MRFVCATNRDPLVEVREGRFREDLFYRLHVVPVRLPPLREREADLMLIAEHFLQEFSAIEGRQFTGFSEEAIRAMHRYPWPGNVRQLQNAMQQVAVLHNAKFVEHGMLPDTITSGSLETEIQPLVNQTTIAKSRSTAHARGKDNQRAQIEPLWLTEKNAVESAIAICGGNVNRAAGLLEVAPSTLYRKLQSWKKIQAC